MIAHDYLSIHAERRRETKRLLQSFGLPSLPPSLPAYLSHVPTECSSSYCTKQHTTSPFAFHHSNPTTHSPNTVLPVAHTHCNMRSDTHPTTPRNEMMDTAEERKETLGVMMAHTFFPYTLYTYPSLPRRFFVFNEKNNSIC